MEIVEVPHPPPEYRRFAEKRVMWQLLGATTDYDTMAWAEVQEAMVFATLEEKHPHRFSKGKK
jgi:hypothetical protein